MYSIEDGYIVEHDEHKQETIRLASVVNLTRSMMLVRVANFCDEVFGLTQKISEIRTMFEVKIGKTK